MNKAPKIITTQEAITFLDNKIRRLEATLNATIKMFEKKLGNHESYVADNITDSGNITDMFSSINDRLIDLESLHDRISKLESENRNEPEPQVISLPVVSVVPAKVVVKKKSTVKLTELTDNGPGISFT
jgi:hypothetical protein